MAGIRTVISHSFLLGLVALSSACVVHERSTVVRDPSPSDSREEAYREGYYDREHNRYYHEHTWHDCLEHDQYCH